MITRTIRQSVRSLLRDQRGSAVIVLALSMPVVVASAAFGVETSYWYYTDRQLQAAADAAAYAGGLEKRAGSNTAYVLSAATKLATDNGFESSGTITVNSPPTSGTHMTPKAVEVTLQENKKRMFSGLFLRDDVAIKVRSVALIEDAGKACVLALDKTASKAALFSGSSTSKFLNCSVMANSHASNAVTVQGTGKLAASCVYSAGGVSAGTGIELTDSNCPAAKTHVPAVGDPFAYLVAPSTAGPCQSKTADPLQPGVYCNGLTLQNTVHLSPGTYVITGGDFKVNANANVSCPTCIPPLGVTIYLAGSSRVSINGTALINLAAPVTGDYHGVLFFGDRSSTGGNKNSFNGTAASSLTGAIYFASQAIDYAGNFSGDGGCTNIVGLTVGWSGNANVTQDCSAKGIINIPATQLVKLVE